MQIVYGLQRHFKIKKCPEWDSNPHWTAFETAGSTDWPIGARLTS